MDPELFKYFQDGITIDKLRNGKYSVFTVKTQRFAIDSLEQLTPETFETAIKDLALKEEIKHEAVKEETKKMVDESMLSVMFPDTIFPHDFNYNIFNTIVSQPKNTKTIASGGKEVSVGDKYKLTLTDDSEHEVYIMDIDQPHRASEEDAKVMFMIGYNGAFQIFTIREMKKRVKLLEKIL